MHYTRLLYKKKDQIGPCLKWLASLSMCAKFYIITHEHYHLFPNHYANRDI